MLDTSAGVRVPVDRVSFDIFPGETFSLVGESGCGKSLTALSILRLLPPGGRIAEGRILLHGRDISGCSEADIRRIRGRRIAMIFQEPQTSLNPVLSIGAQIVEALHAGGEKGSRRAVDRAVGITPCRGDFGTCTSRPGVSTPTLGRHETAGHDRHGNCDESRHSDCRRAHDCTGRHGSGSDPGLAQATASRYGDGLAPHHP